MKILIIGSGAREHALGWKLAQDQQISTIYFAHGNAGTKREAKGKNIPIDATKKEHLPDLIKWLENNTIDLIIIGSEAPLSWGLADHLKALGLLVFAPSQATVLLESDKFFSFDLMQQLDIPQANGRCCSDIQESIEAIEQYHSADGVVLKARGLTGGKGVFVANSKQEALDILEKHSEKYGRELLISERLQGDEFSIFAICDGKKALTFNVAFQDYKPLFDDENAPNTGGMGAYSPVPKITTQMIDDINQKIIQPILDKFAHEGTPYIGFLYLGMILTSDGYKVLEFNVRFGDPECQPAMFMLADDLYPLLKDAAMGELKQTILHHHKGASCCVILATDGYPKAIKKGCIIKGLDNIKLQDSHLKVFHAGTTEKDNNIVNTGGRVLAITAYSDKNIEEARQKVYDILPLLSMEGHFVYRTDIAQKSL